IIGAQRNTRILGTFTRLLLRDGKSSYLQLIPRTWRHVETDLAHPALAVVRAWLDRHIPASARRPAQLDETLLARVARMSLAPAQRTRLTQMVSDEARSKPGPAQVGRSTAAIPARAMVLAAGLGTRLRPLTDTVPKPMVRVAGKPMIDTVIDRLAAIGVREIVVNTHHLAEVIENHVGARKDVHISFSREDPVLETGGGIKKALPLLGSQPFYAVNGKIIWLNGKIDALVRLAEVWNDDQMDGLLLLQPTTSALGHDAPGDFFIDQLGRVRRRREGEGPPFA